MLKVTLNICKLHTLTETAEIKINILKSKIQLYAVYKMSNLNIEIQIN